MTSVSSDAGPSLPSRTPSSASPTSTLDLNDYIEEFFRYRPDTLHEGERRGSPSTRPPAFFDRHLDPHLQLRHIEYLPSITADLMTIADEAMEAAISKGTLPPDCANFPTPDVRASQTRHIKADRRLIVSEEDVKSNYARITAKFCCTVAATLEFQLGEWISTPLEYTLTTDQKCGIADGFLTIVKGTLGSLNAPKLPEKYTLVADTFPSLAVWEFKNPNSGRPAVMEAIVRQATGDMAYDWEGCEHGKKCVALHAGKNGLPPVTGNRMGLDAEPPTCPSVNDVEPRVPTGSFVSLTKRDRISAGHITQQSWSEAVQEDATFIIIHAGNLEIICIRHRKLQTLFVSDVVKVDDCDYGRLHTGLYIAILRDAANRVLQLRPPDIPTTWTKVYGEHAVSTMSAKEIFNQACLRDWLVLLPSSKKPSLVGFKLDTFYFRAGPSKELKDNTQADLLACFKIILKKQIALFVAKGALEVNGKRIKNALTGSVVVKVAYTEDAITKLINEHKIYLDLSRAGISELPHVIGFFQYVDIEGSNDYPLPCAVLVMEDVGSPVCHLSEGIVQQHLTLFQNLLKRVHSAGIIHNNLSREHFMIRGKDPAKVSIVSFGSARKVEKGQEALFDDEYSTLSRLLPSPSKRSADRGLTECYKAAFPVAQARAA